MKITGAEYQKLVRAQRKEKGLCNKCGKPPEPGRKMCRACLDSACERQKAHHAKRFKDDPVYREWYRKKSLASSRRRRADPEMRAKMWARAREAARARRDLIQRIKLERGCMDCGYKVHPEALDFDHTNPAEKLAIVSRIKTLSMKTLMAEIAKCEVVCANCHRIRTHNRRAAKHAG